MKVRGLRINRVFEWTKILREEFPPVRAWGIMLEGAARVLFGVALPDRADTIHRYRICSRCLFHTDRRCYLCGCYTPYKVATANNGDCPGGKW